MPSRRRPRTRAESCSSQRRIKPPLDRSRDRWSIKQASQWCYACCMRARVGYDGLTLKWARAGYARCSRRCEAASRDPDSARDNKLPVVPFRILLGSAICLPSRSLAVFVTKFYVIKTISTNAAVIAVSDICKFLTMDFLISGDNGSCSNNGSCFLIADNHVRSSCLFSLWA